MVTILQLHLVTYKRSLTLIEVMLVMVLIGIGLGALAFQASKALKKGKFESGVEQIMGKIALAQEIMLDFRTDVTLTLRKQQDGIECLIETLSHLPPHLEKGINRSSLIAGIDSLAFNNGGQNEIKLLFEGGLGITPKGELTLSFRDLNSTLSLKGFPAHIKKIHNESNNEGQQTPYPEEILSAL